MRLDNTHNARKETYLHYGNAIYAKEAEKLFYETMDNEGISFELNGPIRIVFYNRYRPAVDPLCTDKMTEIAKTWLAVMFFIRPM